MRQLAEKHCDQLRPATETFGGSFGIVFLHQPRELKAREMLEKLIKQAHCLYHRFALLLGIQLAETARSKDGSALEQL
jgi:hypothetical protein